MASRLRRILDAVEVIDGPNQEAIPGDRRRGHDHHIQRVHLSDLKSVPGLDGDGVAAFAETVDLSVKGEW